MHRRGRVAEQKRAIRAIRVVQAHTPPQNSWKSYSVADRASTDLLDRAVGQNFGVSTLEVLLLGRL